MADPDPFQFSSRLSRRDLLWYFIRHYIFDLWTVWIGAFGLAAVYAFFWWRDGNSLLSALIFLVILGFLILAAIFVLATLIQAVRVARMSREDPTLQETQVTVDAEGVTEDRAGSQVRIEWTKIAWVKIKGGYLFARLRHSNLQLMYPTGHLPDGAIDDFLDFHAAATAEEGIEA